MAVYDSASQLWRGEVKQLAGTSPLRVMPFRAPRTVGPS